MSLRTCASGDAYHDHELQTEKTTLLSPKRKRIRLSSDPVSPVDEFIPERKKSKPPTDLWKTTLSSCQGAFQIGSDDLADLLSSKKNDSELIILDIRGLGLQCGVRIPSAVRVPRESRCELNQLLPALDSFLRQRTEGTVSDDKDVLYVRGRLVVICSDSKQALVPCSALILRRLVSHIQKEHNLSVKLFKGGFDALRQSFPRLCERPRFLHIGSTTNDHDECGPEGSTRNSPDSMNWPKEQSGAVNSRIPELSSASPKLIMFPKVTLDLETAETNVQSEFKHNSSGPRSAGYETKRNPNLVDIYSLEISQILPFLFIGNEADGMNADLLTSRNIGSILNLTPKLPFLDQTRFHCQRLEMRDTETENLQTVLETAFKFIETSRLAGRGVLVHCQAGISRSPALVIAYLMAHSSMSLHAAYQYVKSKRPLISPNFGFLGQLFELESELVKGDVVRKPHILDSIIHNPISENVPGTPDDLISFAMLNCV